jgi:cytochrome c oxidase subunit II
MPSPVRRKTLVLVSVALAGLLLPHIACADPAGLTPRGPESPQATRIEDVYWLLLGITAAIFILVEGALILFIVRFRNRGRPRTAEGPQIHGATRLELIWTAIPVVILAAIVAFVLYKLPGIDKVEAARAGGGEVEIDVEGRQFYWNFIYPGGVVQVERLRIPANTPVKLRISSQDVDHSWWIPALQGKFDAIPGKTNQLEFIAKRPGRYIGRCGEFCGYEHPKMVATVEALPRERFEAWLRDESQAQQRGSSSLGTMTFEGVCATCHGLNGQGGVGPALQDNPAVGQAQAVETLLRNGRGKMPPVGRGWSDRQMSALITYLKRFSGGSSSGG